MTLCADAQMWRDALLAAHRSSARPEITLMEVCGTHTHAIAEHALRKLLPAGVRLISGPGCPVCVSGASWIETVRHLCRRDVTVALFGDLLRIPGDGRTLRGERNLLTVYSPEDALELALAEPGREVVFAAVGFEPTLSAAAALLARLEACRAPNFTLLADFKRLRPVLDMLSASGRIDGFLLPGPVASIVGKNGFAGLGTPGVIAGFRPENILRGIELLLAAAARGDRDYLFNNYPEAVRDAGNRTALELARRYFEPGDSVWRGLGAVAGGGWKLRAEWRNFDAAERFALPEISVPEPAGCSCGAVLTGRIAPGDCPLFGGSCTPEHPVGACMASVEGACAAAWRFREVA